MKKININISLFIVILTAAWFRFFNFQNLLYWDLDDEVFTAVLRHIVVDKSPTLLIPNAFLEIGQGPYFHWFAAILFAIVRLNPIIARIFPSLLGIITCFGIYKIGKAINSPRLGYIASFLYASSLFISFSERRFWPLTLNSFLTVITIMIFLKIIQKKYKFIPLLAIPIGFAFHSDPSLLVLGIAAVIAWIVYRFPVPGKQLLLTILILGLFFLPFALAEIRYNGAVSGPLLKTFSKRVSGAPIISGSYYHSFTPRDFLDSLSRIFFTNKSTSIEEQLCHLKCKYPAPFFSPATQVGILLLLLMSFLFFLRDKKENQYRLSVLWIFFISFVIGELLWNKVFKGNLSQNHFSILFPSLILIVSYVLLKLVKKNYILIFILMIYALINFYNLSQSSVTYPLPQKAIMVKSSLDFIENSNYAIYISSNQMVQGWTELFLLYGHPPVSSNWFEFFEWMYKAYSLISTSKINPLESSKSVIIKDKEELFMNDAHFQKRYQYKDLQIIVD